MRTTLARPATKKPEMVSLRFHHGQALLKTAGYYPTLLGMVLEVVQNGIDSNAKNIWLSVNMKTRIISIRDDGEGASDAQFRQALNQVGMTMKDDSKLGQFGYGLICPLGKCKKFVFTSCSGSRGSNRFNEWTFVCDDIVATAQDVEIPKRERPDLVFSRTPKKTQVNWRTEMRVEGFMKDSRLSKIDQESLTMAIQERYSKAMKKRSVVIFAHITDASGVGQNWEIKARRYMGSALPPFKYVDRDSGKTTFEILWAPKGVRGYRGQVLIGEAGNDFLFPFTEFVRTTAADFLQAEVVDALKSGIFEGEILTEKAKLLPDRKSFEKNDALVGLCIAIEQWYAEVGSAHYTEARSARRDERYQLLGVRSLRVVQNLLLLPEFKELAKVVANFKQGTFGLGHSSVDTDHVGFQEGTSLSTHKTGMKQDPEAEVTPKWKQVDDTGEGHKPIQSHHPFSVLGPKGKTRVVVKNDSIGLQFCYDMETSSRLWELDTSTGILYFNKRHPVWVWTDENGGDSALMRLQEYITIQALLMETVPEEQKEAREWVELVMNDELSAMVKLLVMGDKLAGRRTITHKLGAEKPRK